MMSKHRFLHGLLALLIALSSLWMAARPPIARATEGTDPYSGLRAELWSDLQWVPAGGVILYFVEVERVAAAPPGALAGSQTVGVALERKTEWTQEFGAPSIPQMSGGGTATYISWLLPNLEIGDRWLVKVPVTVKPTVPTGAKIPAFLSLMGTGLDMIPMVVQTGTKAPNQTTAANPGAITKFDPINAGTGEHARGPISDLRLGGLLPLTFRRYYASGLKDEGWVTSALGDNWMHNLDLRLVEAAGGVKVIYEGGKQLYFLQPLGVPGWSLNYHQEPVPFQLSYSGTGSASYWLMDPAQDLVFRFDGEDGLLQEIRDRNGNRLTVAHNAQGDVTQVNDGLGRVLTFSYTNRKLTQVSDGTRHVDFTYNGSGHLATAKDAAGTTVTYRYAAGLAHGPLLTGLELPEGNTPYTQAYNGAGQATSQTDAYGHAAALAYNAPAAGQTRATAADGSTQVLAHDDGRLGTAVQDEAGNEYTIEFDDRERAEALNDRLGDTTTVTYHDRSGKMASYTDAAGHTTTYEYEPREQTFSNGADSATFTFYDLARVIYADGACATYSRDGQGNVLAYTDPAGATWSYNYNGRGQVLTATGPRGGVVTYSYGADGTVATATSSETGATAYAYDGLRRLSSITRPGGATVQFTYGAVDQLLTVTDELGRVWTFSYDANGNLMRAANPLGQAATYVHDLMDRPATDTDPLGQPSAYTYDERGRLATVTDRNGVAVTLGYDVRGWLNRVTNGLGQAWTISYDAEGVPTGLASPLGRTIGVESDELGRTTALVDPLGGRATFTYDVRGRVTAVVDRVGRQRTYGYDAAGRLVSVTEGAAHSLAEAPVSAASYERDEQGQVVAITDPRGNEWQFEHTPLGLPATLTDPLGNEWAYSYDDRGRLVHGALPDGGTVTATYNNAGQVTRLAYSGGPTLNYGYDGAGRLTSVTEGAAGLVLAYDARGDAVNSLEGAAQFGATYDNGRRLRTVTYDGQMAVTYGYDAANRLVRVEDDLSGAWLKLVYDDDGQLAEIERSNGVTTACAYNEAGQLTGIEESTTAAGQSPSAALASQQYTLNAEGEVAEAERVLPFDPQPNPVALSIDLSYDAANQIATSGYAYDEQGRQTAAPGRAFTYDGAGRLAAVTAGAATAELWYNGLGDLRSRTAEGTTTAYYHNYALGLAPIVAETAGLTDGQHLSASSVAYKRFYVYAPGGQLLYSVEAETGAVRFYHYDRVGSTLFLTGADGAVTDAYAYTPYGLPLGQAGSSDQPFRYVGQYGVRWEPVGELYDMRARVYDPRTARFLTRDPEWPDLGNPQELNPYQYALQNPLRYVDPAGTEEVDWFGAYQLMGMIYTMLMAAQEGRLQLSPQQFAAGVILLAQLAAEHPEMWAKFEKEAAPGIQEAFDPWRHVMPDINEKPKAVTWKPEPRDPRMATTPDITEWTFYMMIRTGQLFRTGNPLIDDLPSGPLPGKIVTTPDINQWTFEWMSRTGQFNVHLPPGESPPLEDLGSLRLSPADLAFNPDPYGPDMNYRQAPEEFPPGQSQVFWNRDLGVWMDRRTGQVLDPRTGSMLAQ